MYNTPHIRLTAIAVMLITFGTAGTMTGCSSSSDTTQNTSTTRGVITGFGSVFVNGIEYETDNATITEEDNVTTEDALEVGMVVTLQGSVNSDGMTGNASMIAYDDNIEGIVIQNNIAVDGTLNVMGQTVSVTADSIFESHVAGINAPADIAPQNVVEVSGYSSGNGSVMATRIEVISAGYTPGEEIELKGTVSASSGTMFMIGSLNIDYSGAVLDGVTAPIPDGTFVEVKSTQAIDIPSMTMIASEVEAEDDGIDESESGEVELQGIVTAVNSDSEFVLNDRTVTHGAGTEFEHGSASDITVGAHLEAEGHIDASGNLVAEEIEFHAHTEIEVNGHIDAVDTANSTVTVFGQVFHVNNDTSMLDDSDMHERFFSLADLAVGDRIEIHAYLDDSSSNLVARRMERENDDTSGLEIKGPVDADVTANAASITMFGVTVDTSAVSVPAMSAGDSIELTGDFVGGQFVATQIEL